MDSPSDYKLDYYYIMLKGRITRNLLNVRKLDKIEKSKKA